MLDVLFERRSFMHEVSRQQKELLTVCPPHWIAFFSSLREVSLPGYIKASSDNELKGLFARVSSSYQQNTTQKPLALGSDSALNSLGIKRFSHIPLSAQFEARFISASRK